MEQQYLTTLAYFEPSPAEARALVKEAADLHQTVDDAQSSWVAKTRSIERLKEVERLIQTSRMAHRQAAQQQVRQPERSFAAAPVGLIRSDCGTAFLMVENAGPAEPQQLFAQPVPYA